ncbi:MAG TPA: family 16 glycosylhydrolase [Candidatus Limnocylindrales bacterium]|nr:family 16 glycosylhydrolase [Candidatus Limnocylindrales bacterium]
MILKILAARIGLVVVFSAAITRCPAADNYHAEPYLGSDLLSDTWVATDGTGRRLPGFNECGPQRKDRWVGIFYWTWHRPQAAGPNDNTKVLAAATNGVVHWPDNGAPFHWGEPELGYYLMTDPFVIRKHASMLADAGVDVILFDTTNPPFTWKEEYEALCREYTAMRRQGMRTPAIAFFAPFGDPRPVTDQLWRELYQPGLWKPLWFVWEGKPLLLADKQFIKDAQMLAFFTFRRPMPDYWVGPSGPEQWSWLEVYPQHVFTNAAGEPEQMSVGVAQNALPNTPGPAPMSHKLGAMGRSWHKGQRDLGQGAVDLALNFDEQWRRALEIDPKFIFVTGWNEWIAGRYTRWSKYTDAECYYPGGLFVDEYTQEYSRDCEPMRGGHSDNYYYQLASWVRRYKGVRERPLAMGPSRIVIDGTFDDWKEVAPEFRDAFGDTLHRNHRGYGDLVYRNDTGRNDFVLCKCAYDLTNIYFYAQTLVPITPRTDTNWMLLFLDTDQNAATGWLGYDYVINLEVPGDKETTIKSWHSGNWQTVGQANYCVHGNALELSLPRTIIQQTNTAPAFDFHWADNIQGFGDVSELGVNGDSAPNRRWNYRYEVLQADARNANQWTRTGALRATPKQLSESVPLSEQHESGLWIKYEPMSDEFEAGSFDNNKWVRNLEWWQGRAPALFKSENVVVANGQLQLTMRQEALPEQFRNSTYHDYSSAAVHSKDRICYGYFEVKARPMNSAGSSSFWFQQDGVAGWDTEIDVFEIGGKAPLHERKYHMNLHVFARPTEKRHWSMGKDWEAPWNLADDFHVYGLEWDKDHIKYYVDGVLVRQVQNTHWHQPLYLIFDSETMPDWFGMPDNHDLPSTFCIEYIRAWKQRQN